jgi:hypothetical protein
VSYDHGCQRLFMLQPWRAVPWRTGCAIMPPLYSRGSHGREQGQSAGCRACAN